MRLYGPTIGAVGWWLHTRWGIFALKAPSCPVMYSERYSVGCVTLARFRGWRLTWRKSRK